RGVKLLITSMREFDGRTFATNVLEGVIIALAGKRPEEMSPQDYLATLRKMEWEPTVRDLGNG
ncbi:MAG: quinate 5-dehydrogenase, partial [Armatimonadetes bacterium]|nr:quinate 5-dehydrogenase [Armatimonadota bacterium]